MKIKFSWWESDNCHHNSEWDVPFCDPWGMREYIQDQIDLVRLRVENNEMKKLLAVAQDKP